MKTLLLSALAVTRATVVGPPALITVGKAFALISVLALLAVACGSSDDAPPSLIWDTDSDVHGSAAEYVYTVYELPDIVKAVDAIAMVKVTGVAGVERAGPLPNKVNVEDPKDQAQFEQFAAAAALAPLSTNFSAEVETWIKGSGDEDITINAIGGFEPDGTPDFLDGSFILEPGRKYIVLLGWDATRQAYRYGLARGNFDVTDGVKVLNHPDTRDLEWLEQKSVPELEDYLRQLADAQ